MMNQTAIAPQTSKEQALARSRIALTSPGGYATYASEGEWRRARHLDYLNRSIVEVATGRLDILIVSMPPRYGKSELVSRYTPPWFLTVWPNKNVILTSYEADFAAEWGQKARSLYGEHTPGMTGYRLDPESSARTRWDIVDPNGKTTGGGMRTAGVMGPITGKGAHLLIIDDPVKNADEAESPVYRERAWKWFQSTAYSRLEPGGGLILVQTRWNVDDLAGRLSDRLTTGQFGDVTYRIINFPALAVETPEDALGRKPDQCLWPWRYSQKRVEQKRDALSPYWWSCLYQGNPYPRGGKTFQRKWFRIADTAPKRVAARVRFWDMAATKDAGDYTVGVLMSKTDEELYAIESVVRGQWSVAENKKIVRQTARLDGPDVAQRMEQELGAAGKTTIALYKTLLLGHDFDGVSSRKDKKSSWKPFADEAEVGNVVLLKRAWTEDFLFEIERVPDRRGHDDQADAAAGAFKYLAEIEEMYDICFV